MDIIIGLIVNAAFLVALIGSLMIWARIREKKMTPDAFTVRKPMFPAYTGAVVTVFSGFLFIVSLIGFDADTDVTTLLVIAAFLAAGIFMVADAVYWKVSVDKNRITYRALFRKSGEAGFRDITHAKAEGMRMTVYSGEGKLFAAAVTYTGYRILSDRLRQENITIDGRIR